MIYLYDSTETDFRYNGKPLPTAYDVTVNNTLNSEYYVMGKYPLDKDKVYKEIVEDSIIKVHTMDGMEPFRIVSVSKRELYVEFEAWPLFYADMRNKLVKPLNLKGVSGQAALNSFKNNLLIDTPFDFYSDITSNHDYHTQDENERESNPKQLYNALDVFKAIVNRWGGELWIRGYDIRVNKRIGTDTEAMLYEKKNITEFVDTTNIEGIVTRLHGKSEWTSQEHVDSGSETVIPTDPSERPAAAYKGNAGFSKLDVGDPVTIRSGMQYFLTFRVEKNPETNRDKTYYYQIPIKKDYTGYKDEIVEVKSGVSVGYSYNAYYLKNLQKWVLAQDIVESYGKEGVSYGIKTTVDSPLINNYSGIVFEKQYTNNDIRTEQELKNWLNLKFTTENIDKPQRTIEVGTNVIDETKIGFADTLILKYIKHDTDVRIKVIGYEYDGFANELKHVVLGQPKNTSSSTIGNTITDLVNNVVEPVDRKTTIAMNSADGKSTVFHGTADPNTLNLNAKENDTYFRTNGSEKEIWRFTGTLWELVIDTSDTTKNAREIEAVIEQAETDRAELEEEIDSSLSLAKAHADAEIVQIGEHFDDLLAEVESDVADAQATADSAVEQIDTAVVNAGFTSLDDTIQNMNYITINAEQNAQQAITDANNAYGLAQTSISEAQTAQANSLSALGQVEDVQTGVSSLSYRVDDVEAELELKADNTFMNEDGTLTTLSNAITFNAHRFSSDMSRIESRVESLSGEINLVILRDAFIKRWLLGGEVYPNPSVSSADCNTMREMIAVTPGEQFALSKSTVPGDNFWRINCYTQNMEFIVRLTPNENETIITVPNNAHHMWVSYPQGSNPQIVRGETFFPYRPNFADQMTTNEMVMFRNEYDEYADRTERRLTAIDSTGGSLDVLSNEIVTTAERVTTDMTALINTKVGDEEFTEFYQNEYLETAQEVSRKISLSDVKVGGRNRIKDSHFNTINNWSPLTWRLRDVNLYGGTGYFARVSDNWNTWQDIDILESGEYVFGADIRRLDGAGSLRVSLTYYDEADNQIDSFSHLINAGVNLNRYSGYKFVVPNGTKRARLYLYGENGSVFDVTRLQLEKGNLSTDWSPAVEDSDEKINRIETEWTQTFDTFQQTVSATDGRVNTHLQTIDNSLSAISDPMTGRLTIAEQNINGFRNEVYNADGSSKITQLATGISSVVTNLNNLESGGRNYVLNSHFNNADVGWGSVNLRLRDVNLYGDSGYFVRVVNAWNTWQDIDILESGNYVFSALVRRHRGIGNLRVHLNLFNGNGETLVNLSQTIPETFDRHTDILFKIPQNTRRARLYLYTTDPDGEFDVTKVKLEKGTKSTDWTVAPEDTQSQITQLADNINLRVSKGDVINQINVSTEGILIDGKKTHITGTTTIDNGVIKNAHIAELNASKINAGTIDAARIDATDIVTKGLTADVIKSTHISADTALFNKLFTSTLATDRLSAQAAWIKNGMFANASIDGAKIRDATIGSAQIANLDVSRLSGSKTNFVQSNWNAINSNLTIDADKLVFTHSKNNSQTIMSANGLFHSDGGSDYHTNYLFDIFTITGLNHRPGGPYIYTLPPIYRNKDFKAVAVFSDAYGVTESANYHDFATLRIVTYVDRPNIDRVNGKVPIIGYHRAGRMSANEREHFEIQVQLLVQY